MAHLINAERRKFLDQPPPPGYIAGLGRGAVGFTTRSDIGGARNIEPGSVPGFGDKRKFGADDDGGGGGDDDDEDFGGGKNYDEFEGDSRDGFSDPRAIYDQEDKEADDIWASIDKKMDSRRKERREKREKEVHESIQNQTPKLQQQLVDLKQQLATVAVDEWLNLPEAGDISRNNQRNKREVYVPVPDIIIERAKQENETVNVIQPTPASNVYGDLTSGTTTTDLTQFGSARKTVLDLKLNQAGDNISGKTCIDPKGYLTDLKSQRIASSTEISDIKKARLLFKSVTSTNPKHAPGWIAAAKLEMLAGKLSMARKIIAQGCQECPDDEEVWIENANLQTPDNAKLLLAQAVKVIPHSIKIWLYAAALERDIKKKKRVLRRALEFVPTSVRLWKEAVELEEPQDAKILLGRAVECVSDNVDLWLALANLETYERAREVLNKARTCIPTSMEIWIAAAQLEESVNRDENVRKVIKKAIRSLSSASAHQGTTGGASRVTDRERWISEAEKCEKNGSLVTCQAIIFEAIGIGIDDDDRKRVWCADASELLQRGSTKTASAVYAYILTVFPNKKSIWIKVADLEKQYGTAESLENTYIQAIKNCPQNEILWLKYAKEKWLSGDANGVDRARAILKEAATKIPSSEEITLAAVKIESEMKRIDLARDFLQKAISTAPTERIWMKAALLEREYGDPKQEGITLDQGLKSFPQSWKMWLMRAQLEERIQLERVKPLDTAAIEKIRSIFTNATNQCPNSSVWLWIEAHRFEVRAANNINRARAILEKAGLRMPKREEILLEFVRFENKVGNKKAATNMLAIGLQECPTSGMLWAESIAMEPRHAQKNKCVDALNKCNNDPYVLTEVARIFWIDGKYDKARTWFNRAIATFPDHGDAWAYYYAFLLKTVKNSTTLEQETKELQIKCLESDPHHGQLWQQVSKAKGNSILKSDQILKLVALQITQQQQQQLSNNKK